MARAWSIAVLLLVVTLLVPQLLREVVAQDADTCVLCEDTHSIACATCKATGAAPAECDVCSGNGRLVCRDGVQSIAGFTVGLRHHGKSHDCPNEHCRDGTVRWTDGREYGCKLCGKRGTVKCRRCELSGRHRCAQCKGSRKAALPCGDCAGSGRIDCGLCADAGACRTCKKTETLPCTRCEDGVAAAQTCGRCAGAGRTRCGHCKGVVRKPCPRCACTGAERTRYAGGSTTSSKKCRICKRRGFLQCSRCTKGVVACETCDGLGTHDGNCRSCRHRGTIACPTCGDRAYRVAELGGDALRERELRAEAAALYSESLRLLRARSADAQERLDAAKAGTPKKPKKPRGLTLEQELEFAKLVAEHWAGIEIAKMEAERAETELEVLADEIRRVERSHKRVTKTK